MRLLAGYTRRLHLCLQNQQGSKDVLLLLTGSCQHGLEGGLSWVVTLVGMYHFAMLPAKRSACAL
jgi:hypothetical protein